MNRVKVQNIIKVHEVDGKDVAVGGLGDKPCVYIRSGAHNNLISIGVDYADGPVGHEVTITASDLEAAICNARNTR